jgi:diguanylate cyclase (GGDEF)-like protein
MILDVRTLMITNFFYTFLIAIAFSISYNAFSGQVRASLKTLSTAMYLMAIGWIFLGLRGFIPVFHSVLWGNLASLLGLAELVNTVRVFDGKSTKRRFLYPMVFIINVANIYFLVINNLPSIRIAIISFATALFSIIIAYAIFHKSRYTSKIRYGGGLVIALFAIISIMRAVDSTILNFGKYTLLSNSILQTYYLVIIFIFTFSMTFAFSLMCTHRFSNELKKQTIIDPITNLYNRNGIKQILPDKIQDALNHNHPLCLAVFDIDEFRKFNDLHGLESGDNALQEMSNTLQKFTGPEDIAGRLGGDEFMLILPQKNYSASIKIVNDIVEDFQKKNISSNQKDVRLIISSGVAMLDADHPNSDMLIKNAHHELFKVRTLSEDSYGT